MRDIDGTIDVKRTKGIERGREILSRAILQYTNNAISTNISIYLKISQTLKVICDSRCRLLLNTRKLRMLVYIPVKVFVLFRLFGRYRASMLAECS